MRDPKQVEIAKLALFSECATDDIRWVATHADVIMVGPGTELSIAGSSVREFVVIVDGVASSDGVLFGPGSYVGEELLDGRIHTSTVEAVTDIKMLVLGPREFRGLVLRAPSVAKRLMQDLANRIRVQDALSLRAVS